MGLGPNWEYMLYTKSSKFLCRKRISMLTDLKASSLSCKHVFYRPEHNTKGDPMGQKYISEIYQRIEFKKSMRKVGSFV